MGMSLRKTKGIIKQKFFFRGQRPKWHSVPTEELFKLGYYNDTKKIIKFANSSLIQS